MRATTLVGLGCSAVMGVTSLPALADGSGSGGGSWIGYVFGGNQATGLNSTVVAGANNFAGAQGAFVGAGTANQATGLSSMVIGGFDNRATLTDALVGAGAGNRATGPRSIVVGGGYNLASGPWSFIGGGGRDGIETIPAGTHERDNVATHKWTVVVGGFGNVAAGERATVGGGSQNGAGGIAATVAGGAFNTATGNWSTVAGGSDNQATNQSATVAGGQLNTASGFVATVAGGFLNDAIGQFSFAAGLRAIAAGDGTFAIADSSSDNLDWSVAVANSFGARYTGGFTFATAVDPATGLYQKGCQLFGNSGTFSCTSDRATKTAFTPIDVRAILRDVVTLPITAWRFDGEPVAVRHIGPMSQDFYAAFGLSHDDKSISMLDGQGVALAAIQGLNAKLEAALTERDSTIAAQANTIAELRVQSSAEIAELRRAVDVLLARTSSDSRVAASR